jgi:hypothetical protein
MGALSLPLPHDTVWMGSPPGGLLRAADTGGTHPARCGYWRRV